MRAVSWLLRAVFFFFLFAFALNNQQAVTVHGFFGQAWEAPLVVVMACVFVAGAALGALAMVPSWWRQWRQARKAVRQQEAQGLLGEGSTGSADHASRSSGPASAAIPLDASGNPIPPDVVRR